jgi:hypothetical protein
MSTEQTRYSCSSPACKSATPGGCSDCSLAYDCQRSATGFPVPWPLVAIALVGLAMFAMSGFGI